MMSLPIDRRSAERSKVMLSALVEQEGLPSTMKVMNLSAGGALLFGSPLEQGRSVRFCREGNDVPGRIAWVRGDECGLSFERPLNVRSVLRTVPAPKTAFRQPARRPGLKSVELSRAELDLLDTWVARGATLYSD